MYVELHAASAFSFLRGASLPETLAERAAALGYPALALLDLDGVYGAPRFHKAALAAGIRPLIGAELTIETRRESGSGTSRESGVGSRESEDRQITRLTLPVLVSSQQGWQNLCRLVTKMKLRAPTSLRQGYGGPPELQRRRSAQARAPRGAVAA